MASISVTWKCGHTEHMRARAHAEAYWTHRATTEICRDCWREQQNQQAAEAAQQQGLPPLRGTPKQVEWAETLRQTKLTEVAELEATIPATDPNLAKWKQLVDRLQRATNAAWWIDRRDETPLCIFRRWEAEAREAARLKPVSELIGKDAAEAPIETVPQPYQSSAASRARLIEL